MEIEFDKELAEKIMESRAESGFSIMGFTRRDFAMMAVICQEVLLDEELLEKVAPLTRFKGHPFEIPALTDKINDFLDV